MPSLGPTLLEHIWARRAQNDAYAKQQADVQSERDYRDREQFLKGIGDDFERRLKLVELEAKMRGALGQPAPTSTHDPRLNEAIGPSYMAGQYAHQQDESEDWYKKAMLQNQIYQAGANRDERARESDSRAEQAKINAQNAMDNHRLAQMMMQNKQEETNQNRQDIRIQKLGTDLKDLGGAKNDMEILSKAIQQKDIPGQGPYDQFMTNVGLGSNDDITTRQAAKRLLITYLHNISGTAVTDSEADRAADALGLNSWVPEKFRAGVKALIHNYKTQAIGLQAKARPEDVEVYRQRGSVTAQDLPDEETTSSKTKSGSGNPLYDELMGHIK